MYRPSKTHAQPQNMHSFSLAQTLLRHSLDGLDRSQLLTQQLTEFLSVKSVTRIAVVDIELEVPGRDLMISKLQKQLEPVLLLEQSRTQAAALAQIHEFLHEHEQGILVCLSSDPNRFQQLIVLVSKCILFGLNPKLIVITAGNGRLLIQQGALFKYPEIQIKFLVFEMSLKDPLSLYLSCLGRNNEISVPGILGYKSLRSIFRNYANSNCSLESILLSIEYMLFLHCKEHDTDDLWIGFLESLDQDKTRLDKTIHTLKEYWMKRRSHFLFLNSCASFLSPATSTRQIIDIMANNKLESFIRDLISKTSLLNQKKLVECWMNEILVNCDDKVLVKKIKELEKQISCQESSSLKEKVTSSPKKFRSMDEFKKSLKKKKDGNVTGIWSAFTEINKYDSLLFV